MAGPAAGVVLAAGAGTRHRGAFKLLLPYRGETVVAAVVSTALEAGLEPVVAVLGHRSSEVREALEGLPARTVVAAEWERGQAASLARGVREVREDTDADGAAVLLGDEPGLEAEVVRRAVARWRAADAPILRCVYRDRPGHPVLFDRACFEELEALTGDRGARGYLERNRDRVRELAVDRPAPVDLDTREDYERLRS